MNEERIVRFVLPPSIVLLSLPNLPLGVFGLVANISASLVSRPNPGTHEAVGIFWVLCALIAMITGRIELICTVCAFALWLWLLLRGKFMLTKVFTFGAVVFAVYGHYLLQSGFLNR